MKICRVKYNERVFFGRMNSENIELFDSSVPFADICETTEIVESLEHSRVVFLPPVSPSKIVCVGRNYAEHAAELGNEIPKEPLLFLKAPSSLIKDGQTIIIPEQSAQVEHEGELAVVIRRDCSKLKESDEVSDYIFGFTCLNDVTARDIQRNDVQFTRAKSFDTFCPIGNFLETGADVSDVSVVTKVNGIVKQSGRTSQMVFGVKFLIRYISNQMTLNSGDIIATGTPAGVSKLEPGDLVEVEIENVGNLKNPVSSQR